MTDEFQRSHYYNTTYGISNGKGNSMGMVIDDKIRNRNVNESQLTAFEWERMEMKNVIPGHL